MRRSVRHRALLQLLLFASSSVCSLVALPASPAYSSVNSGVFILVAIIDYNYDMTIYMPCSSTVTVL
jgi:hypothetical protein